MLGSTFFVTMSFLYIIIILVLLFTCISSSNAAKTKFYGNQSHIIKDYQGGICGLMVQTQGYYCEEHQVTTNDGYILSLQRISQGGGSENVKSENNSAPVLLQHGLISNAGTWLAPPTNQALAFVLADAGYDVWVSNCRGTDYSNMHTSLAQDDPAYWDWSWDELVAYDLPAFVQYVHDQTGQNLHYAGHSLGTLMALAAFSQGNVLDMLRSAAMISPIAYLGQIRSGLVKVAADDVFLDEQLYWLGINKFDPDGDSGSMLLKNICDLPGINCSDLLSAITGPNCCLNSSAVIARGFQPTSTKNMIHLAQMIRRRTIRMYDYGNIFYNFKRYRQLYPPAYTMSNISKDFPLFMIYGGQDYLSTVNDVQHLLNNDLKDHHDNNLSILFKDNYAHLDFVYASNAKEQVHDPLMDFFRRH